MAGSTKSHLGHRVRKLREEKGWSQSALAAHLPGVRQQSIDQLERGRVKRPRFLPELAQVLGTQVQWLLTGEGKRETARPRKGDNGIDVVLLRDVFAAVERVLTQNQNGKITLDQKAGLISALYEMMCGENHRTAEKIATAATNIVSYDRFLKSAGKN